jgi:hypothetical protein
LPNARSEYSLSGDAEGAGLEAVVVQLVLGARLAPADQIDRRVQRDAMDPAVEGRLTAELIAILPGPEQRFLHGVGCKLRIPRDAQTGVVPTRAALLEHGLEDVRLDPGLEKGEHGTWTGELGKRLVRSPAIRCRHYLCFLASTSTILVCQPGPVAFQRARTSGGSRREIEVRVLHRFSGGRAGAASAWTFSSRRSREEHHLLCALVENRRLSIADFQDPFVPLSLWAFEP